MKLKLRKGFGCHWPSSPHFLSPTLSFETCQIFARKCLRSSFLIQTLEILHLLVDIVASAYLLGGKKFRLRSNKKLRHALLSRPTAPGPHIPPARADKYVFQTELFSWHALLSPLSSPPCWLRSRDEFVIGLPTRRGHRTTKKLDSIENRDLFQLDLKICNQLLSRLRAVHWKPTFCALSWGQALVFVIVKSLARSHFVTFKVCVIVDHIL